MLTYKKMYIGQEKYGKESFFFSVYKRFSMLNPDMVARDKNAKLSQDDILSLPELKVKITYVPYVA